MERRKVRKWIYTLQENPSPVSQLALRAVLAGYRTIDSVFLRRSASADYRSEKLVSRQRKFLCVLVPKCGSRTLLGGLRTASVGQFDLDVRDASIDQFLGGYENYFRFAIVRNPWARCFSCYREKFEHFNSVKGARHFNGRKGLRPDMSFAQFVGWLCGPEGRDEIADRHWLSQYRILGLDRGARYDFIGKLETLEADLKLISSRLAIDPSLFHHRLRTSAPDEYLKAYTPELAEAVHERYACDVEQFGYGLEAPSSESVRLLNAAERLPP
jgi:hypothetical protein